MRKGKLFLLAALVLLPLVMYLIYLEEMQPRGVAPQNPPAECGADLSCFESAVADGCRPAVFLLPDPRGNGTLDGQVIGSVFDKCDVLIEDKSGDSMRCSMTTSSFSAITSFSGLKTACSGSLLERLAG